MRPLPIHRAWFKPILPPRLSSTLIPFRNFCRKTSPAILLAGTIPFLTPHTGDPNHAAKFYSKYSKLLSSHDGTNLMYTVMGINTAIFIAWFIRPQIMAKHFLSSSENFRAGRYHTIITANWSHADLWHIGLNMYCFYNFGLSVAQTVGVQSTLATYMGAGFAGSVASLAWNSAFKTGVASLGASGCILGVLALFACINPETKLHIVFLPQFDFQAKHGLMALMLLDVSGLIFRWRFFDHAAHLGGILCGVGSYYVLKSLYGDRKHGETVVAHNQVFEGEVENFRPTGTHGIIRAPTRTYSGGIWTGNIRPLMNGEGSLRNEKTGTVFHGKFYMGGITGEGVMYDAFGGREAVVYDDVTNSFKSK